MFPDGFIDRRARAGRGGDAWALLASRDTARALVSRLRRLPGVVGVGRPLPVGA